MITVITLAVGLVLASVSAEARPVRLAAPEGAAIELARHLAQSFRAETGLQISILALRTTPPSGVSKEADRADAVLAPERIEVGPAEAERSRVFMSEVVLVGSRADRARVRGLSDIRKALRWIASARGFFVSSSSQLGIRALELSLWDEIGVNVRARPSWYQEVQGGEVAVIEQAAAFGSYALVERATWADLRNRHGLEIIASGDPLLVTHWTSILLAPNAAEVRAWHEWLQSEAGREAIAEFRLNGVPLFRPTDASSNPAPPARQSG